MCGLCTPLNDTNIYMSEDGTDITYSYGTVYEYELKDYTGYFVKLAKKGFLFSAEEFIKIFQMVK